MCARAIAVQHFFHGGVARDRETLHRCRCTDAQYLTFWWWSAAITATLPWTSVGVTTGYRGNPRVFTAKVTAHALARQIPRLWPRHVPRFCPWQTPRVSTMATHGSTRQLPRQFPRTSNHSHSFPRPSAAIATATLRYTVITTEGRGNCHDNFRGRQTTAISTAIRGNCHGNPPIRGNCHGSPWQFPRTSIHSNFHTIPRPSAAIELPR